MSANRSVLERLRLRKRIVGAWSEFTDFASNYVTFFQADFEMYIPSSILQL